MREGTIYLRDRDGMPIGPLPMKDLEVLFATRVISKATPLSADGYHFTPLTEHSAVLARLLEVERKMLSGEDPWVEPTADVPLGGGASPIDLAEISPIAVLFSSARSSSTGVLTFSGEDTSVVLSYLEGKVVDVATDSGALSLAAYLIEKKAADQRAIERAVIQAPSMGGDLGAALIASGAIQVNAYLERLSEWAKKVIAQVMTWRSGIAELEAKSVTPPSVPLGLDRFGVITEALRLLPKDAMEPAFEGVRERPLIPSQLEGVAIENLKLPARELRVIKSIDGTRTLGAVLAAQEGAEQTLSALRALTYAVSIGWLVLGEDLNAPRERDEAKRFAERLKEWKGKSPLDIIGVKSTASNEETHSKYMQLAKELHPDRIRTTAAPELLSVRAEMFALVQNAYEKVETPEKREQAQRVIDMGFAGKDEQAIVRAALEAETLFHKAEVLFKMRKYAEGLEHLDQALERKPQDEEFKMHRVYYRVISAKNPNEQELRNAVNEISATLKKEPNVASGYLLLARLYKLAGNPEAAGKNFKRLLEFDPRNSEALSELRLASMRQQKEKEKKKWL